MDFRSWLNFAFLYALPLSSLKAGRLFSDPAWVALYFRYALTGQSLVSFSNTSTRQPVVSALHVLVDFKRTIRYLFCPPPTLDVASQMSDFSRVFNESYLVAWVDVNSPHLYDPCDECGKSIIIYRETV